MRKVYHKVLVFNKTGGLLALKSFSNETYGSRDHLI